MCVTLWGKLVMSSLLPQIGATMGKFEELFQDLDVHTQVMDSTLSSATTLTTPENQVDALMRQVHDSI